MPWASTRGKKADPALTTYTWRQTRKYWANQLPLRCARGDHMITSAHKFYAGTKVINPRSLVVGHKVARSTARALGYEEAWIHAIEQTQPECWACSSRSGARMGGVQASRKKQAALARSRSATASSKTFMINTEVKQAAAASRW